jgi:NTP pyrophosphatase (non-canonical NTP hydrolase)
MTFFGDLLKETDETWHFNPKKPIEPEDVELLYCVLALAGEAGELANKIKKYFRYKYLTEGHPDTEALEEADEEYIDVIYYLLRTSKRTHTNLEEAWKKKMDVNRKRYT